MNRKVRRRKIGEFRKEKNEYKNLFFKLLYQSEHDDIQLIFKVIIENELLLKKVKNIFLPKDIAGLANTKIVINESLNKDVFEEFIFQIIMLFEKEINKFICIKREYEILLIKESYEEALKKIDRIEQEICISYWSLCQKMMLYEIIYGLEEHKKIMSKFMKESIKVPILEILIEMQSFFVEKNTSYYTYRKKTEDLLKALKNYKIINRYFKFKLDLESHADINEFNILAQIDMQYSIIDLYEVVIKHLSSQNSKSLIDTEKVELVYKRIPDYRLRNILFVYSNKFDVYNSPINNESEMLEKYSIGNYNECISITKEYLEINPLDFQMITLFVKAHINLDIVLEKEAYPSIYYDIYNIYVINEEFDNSVLRMFEFLKVFNGTSLEAKILSFINRKTSCHINNHLLYEAIINDSFMTPSLVHNFNELKERNKYLKFLERDFPVTCSLYGDANINEKMEHKIIDRYRINMFKADRLARASEYEKAIELLSGEEYNEKCNNNYILERINKKKIQFLLKCHKFEGVVVTVVQMYLKNINLIKAIDIQKIYNVLKSSGNKQIQFNMNYVLITYINNSNDYKSQRIAYSNFMTGNLFTSITNIIESKIDMNIIIFFLDKICNTHLLKRDIILNPDGTRADEIRLDILWKLIKIDKANKKAYIKEIGILTKTKSLKDRVNQINQSRIFVDIENIKKENEKYLKENFNRYLTIKNFDEEVYSIDTTSEQYLEHLWSTIEEMNEKIRTNPSYLQEFVIFRSMVLTITEEFLFNEKYGLNTFLSSRIRHGYCKSQLISTLQEHNLLSKKECDDSERFTVNEYWHDIFGAGNEETKTIIKELSVFTDKIESKINEIKAEWLSIKFRDESKSYLDYSRVVSQGVILEKQNFTDFDMFFNEVIDYLWIYTGKIFEDLRDRINTELIDYYIKTLQELENKINSLNKSNETNQLITSINLCKSQLRSSIVEFANIFYKRDLDYKDFTMTELTESCIEIIKKMKSEFNKVSIEKNIGDLQLYNGETLPYFVDVLNILLNNAIDHSGFGNLNDLNVCINITEENDPEMITFIQDIFIKKGIMQQSDKYTRLLVKNNLSGNTDIELIKSRMDSIFLNIDKVNSWKKYTQNEGGTGFYKLYKTFNCSIDAPYVVSYIVEDNEVTIRIVFGTNNIVK